MNCDTGDKEFGGIEFGTNNIAELTAALRALEYILERETEGRPVFVYSDSQYVVRGVMEWSKKWEKTGWSKGDGTIKNLELWKNLVDLRKKTGAEFRWVKGHNGNHWNEMVDSLAAEGAERQIRKFLPGKSSRIANMATAEEDCFCLPNGSVDDVLF